MKTEFIHFEYLIIREKRKQWKPTKYFLLVSGDVELESSNSFEDRSQVLISNKTDGNEKTYQKHETFREIW